MYGDRYLKRVNFIYMKIIGYVNCVKKKAGPIHCSSASFAVEIFYSVRSVIKMRWLPNSVSTGPWTMPIWAPKATSSNSLTICPRGK